MGFNKVKDHGMDKAWKARQRALEKKLISPLQHRIGLFLIIVGALLAATGAFGYMVGDLQVSAFRDLANQVAIAREAAQSSGTKVSGAFDTAGEESGVHVFYAAYETATETGRISAMDFEAGETNKSLKGENLQFPGTKDYKNLVVEEEKPVTLDNGMTFTRSVKLRGAGSSKYRSLKLTVDAPGTLSVYAVSSLADTERRLVLYNAQDGSETARAMAPAADSVTGELAPITFSFEKRGTYYLSSKGDIPLAPLDVIMNLAIIILLAGVVLIFNGVMLRIQRWENMKDLFCVEPALLFFLLFVYYPVIDLVRISFTDMGILTTGLQEFVGLDNYNWLFRQSGAKYFWESLRITVTYTFWEVVITLVGGMLLALLFNRMTRSFNIMRAIVFMPKYIAVSTSAVVFMWILYSPAAAGAALILCAQPLMWVDGIRALKNSKPQESHLLRMRKSGFFDLLMLLVILAAVLLALGVFGLISHNATFAKHAQLAAAGGDAPGTLEEARLLEGFVEYNFAHDLNVFAKNYSIFFFAAGVVLAFVAVCLAYMRFVSPIVAADDSLRIAHGVYRKAAQNVTAVFFTLVMLFPIYWMIISSFKSSAELLAPVPTLWPKEFVFENYPNVLRRAPFGRYLINTLVTTCAIMISELTIGVAAAYGFSKGQFKGRNGLFMLVLGALVVPIQVTFVPSYVLISRLNAIDSYWGIILPNLVSAYFIFMLRQNFMAVDDSYIEAGKLDGMGRIGTIVHVLCPMCKPTLITVSIISFIDGWNNYFWPKMVTKTEASRTIAVGVQQLKNTFAGQEVSNYNEIMAGAVMAIIPIVLLFFFLQKYIMTGMSKAAMK